MTPDTTYTVRIDTGYIHRSLPPKTMGTLQPDTELVLTDHGAAWIYHDRNGQPWEIAGVLPEPEPVAAVDPFAGLTALNTIKPHAPIEAVDTNGVLDKYRALIAKQPAKPEASNEYPWDAYVHTASFTIILLTFALLAVRINNLVHETIHDIRLRRSRAAIASLRNAQTDNRE